jgi:formylglycine-generating enzyme required for sulfatase activity
VKRRRFIQYTGLGSFGLVSGLGTNGFIATLPFQQYTSHSLYPNLQSFKFEVSTVDRSGREIDRRDREARFFAVNLGQETYLEMVAIPGGKFLMGASKNEAEDRQPASEQPQHLVSVKPFFMARYPITQAQWQTVAQLPKINRDLMPDPSHFVGDLHPVESVSWLDAVEFCDRLSKHTGATYRLPSEAEWEYACRAGMTAPFSSGETITYQFANYGTQFAYAAETPGDYLPATMPVGSFIPNAFGLSDMHGNVWEWCADNWHDSYRGAPSDGSTWTKKEDLALRSLRGGAWADRPSQLRAANRSGYMADSLNRTIGFRVCHV